MKAAYRRRNVFVASFLELTPLCQMKLEGCQGRAVDVDELIRRSHGGAIYPDQPDKRENIYFALCRSCHDFKTTHPEWARANGWEER